MRARAMMRLATVGAVLTAVAMQPLVANAHAPVDPEQPSKPAKEAATDPEDDPRKVDARTAKIDDARLIAARTDWSVADTLEHLETQDRFGDLLVQLTERYPRTFSVGVFADRPGAASLVRFTGDVPPTASDLARRAGVRVRYEGGAKYSAQEMRQRADAVHAHLAEAGFRSLATATSPQGVVEVAVRADADVEPDLPKELRTDVEITPVKGPVAEDFHTRGGALVFDNDDGSSCTSGFAVESFSGTTGVTTAGHCTGIDRYVQPSDGLTYSLSHQDEHRGIFGDVEWKTSPHVEPAEYYARANQQRDVTSVEPYGAIAKNNWYCSYGRASNDRECDQVYRLNVSATVNGVWNSSLIAMDNNNSIPGDSGGPVSYGTEATGGIKGYVTIWFKKRDVFSVADLYPSAIGVQVRTQ